MEKVIFENERGISVELGNAFPFILTKIEGTGSSTTTILTTKAPGQDGKSYMGTLLEERILVLNGAIAAEGEEDMYKKRKKLCSVFNSKLTGTLKYVNDAGEYSINCVAQDSPTFGDKSEEIQDFMIQLYCPDPYWKDIQETKEEIALWIGDFEFPLEILEAGIEMGHRVSNLIVNANNPGDVECSMKAEFKALATVVNPSILNIYTQEFIKVKRTLAAGDKLVINTEFGNKSVEMIHNGVNTNVFNYIDLSTTFLQLFPGDNLLRYNAESGIDNLECVIYFTPKYVGV